VQKPHSVFSFEETASNCLRYCSQTTQRVSEISEKSISQDFDFEELTAAVKEIQIQCEKLSEKTYQMCMDTSAAEEAAGYVVDVDRAAAAAAAAVDEILLCDVVKEIFDKTSLQCCRASEQIALDVLPLYEKIIGDCSKKSLECAVEILGLEEGRNNIDVFTELQDSLIQSTVTLSINTSDCILNTILSI